MIKKLLTLCALLFVGYPVHGQDFLPLTLEDLQVPGCLSESDFTKSSIGRETRIRAFVCESGNTNACQPDETHACLDGNRFEVSLMYETVDQKTQEINGQGVGIFHASVKETTAFFRYAGKNPDNIEVFPKVLEACTVSGLRGHWVFAGGLTDVRVLLLVRHTPTGRVVVYENPQGNKFSPVQDSVSFKDTETFDSCEDGMNLTTASGGS